MSLLWDTCSDINLNINKYIHTYIYIYVCVCVFFFFFGGGGGGVAVRANLLSQEHARTVLPKFSDGRTTSGAVSIKIVEPLQ